MLTLGDIQDNITFGVGFYYAKSPTIRLISISITTMALPSIFPSNCPELLTMRANSFRKVTSHIV